MISIYKCTKCGEFIHDSSFCLHCGNNENGRIHKIKEKEIHENTINEMDLIYEKLNNKEFSDVLTLADQILEWMPECAEMFWIRALAKKNCCNDYELILSGIDVESDPDLQNALLFSDNEEKKMYEAIIKKIFLLKNFLERLIQNMKLSMFASLREETDAIYAQIMENDVKEVYEYLSYICLDEYNQYCFEKKKDLIITLYLYLLANVDDKMTKIEEKLNAIENQENINLLELINMQLNIKQCVKCSSYYSGMLSAWEKGEVIKKGEGEAIKKEESLLLTNKNKSRYLLKMAKNKLVKDYEEICEKRDKIKNEQRCIDEMNKKVSQYNFGAILDSFESDIIEEILTYINIYKGE